MAAEQLDEFVDIVGVHAVGGDVGGADGLGQGVALGFVARGDDDFGEHLGILGAFVRHDGADASGADDNDFCHLLNSFYVGFVL